MQSQQNKFHIFLSHILFTMHFPSFSKNLEGEGRSWPGEELRAVGGYGVRRSGERCARARERERERELRGANGSGGGGERDRGHLAADQGVSTPSHARHAAAESCRRATASRRGRPRADAGASAGKGGESAGGPSRLRPVGQKRGRGLLAPPLSLFNFF